MAVGLPSGRGGTSTNRNSARRPRHRRRPEMVGPLSLIARRVRERHLGDRGRVASRFGRFGRWGGLPARDSVPGREPHDREHGDRDAAPEERAARQVRPGRLLRPQFGLCLVARRHRVNEDGVECGDDGGHILRPFVRALGEHPGDESGERGRDVRPEGDDIRRRGVPVGVDPVPDSPWSDGGHPTSGRTGRT